jgi:uncharacterized membrane protein
MSLYNELIMPRNFIKSARLFVDWLSKHPVEFFVVLSLIFGIAMCFRLQPLSGTDEFTHFPRAFQIESGQLFEKKLPGNQYGGYLPNNVVNMINDYRNLTREPIGPTYELSSQQLGAVYSRDNQLGSRETATVFSSDAAYTPGGYLPSIAGIFLAKLVRAPLIWYVYLARLCSLIVYVVLVWLAIKLIPGGKWFLVVAALLPTSITAALTIGQSALLLGTSWLLIAFVFAVMANKVKLTWRVLVALTVLSVMLSIIKQGYIFIALLPLLIPLRHFSKKLNFIIWKVIMGILLLGSTTILGLFTDHIAKGVVLAPISGININTTQQIHYILHNPLVYVGHLLFQPFTKSFDTIYLGLVGIVTQRLIYLSVAMIGLLYLALFLTWKSTSSIPQFVKQRHYFIGSIGSIAIANYLLIATALYIVSTQVGSSVVGGLSGTNFLPLLPLVLIIPMSIRKESDTGLGRTSSSVVLLIVLVGLISTSLSFR